MSRFPERTTGVLLRRLVLDAEIAKASEALRKELADKGDDVSGLTYSAHMEYAGTTVGDTLHVLCTEGVGWEIDEGGLQVDLYASYADEDGKPRSFGIFPAATLTFSPDEVLGLMVGDSVDLSVFVRSFGQRLEDNFWTWHSMLKGIDA